MGQESDSDLGPFKFFVDLITEANDIFPVFLAVRRIGSFILGHNTEENYYKSNSQYKAVFTILKHSMFNS